MQDWRMKYRPNTLDEVWGNEHIKMVWKGYLGKGYFPRSIILSSNFGMGKTTLARIFANDIIGATSESQFDYIETDPSKMDIAAYQKRLYDLSCFAGMPMRVIFIDEAQRMLDKAQDGFLKIIEDVYFVTLIFATTDLHKIDRGLLSRSDKFYLKLPPKDILMRELERIALIEGMKIEKDAIDFLIEYSKHNPRECLGSLQLVSCHDGVIDSKIVKKFLEQ